MAQIRSLTQHLKQVPEFRARVENYPLWSLLAIAVCAILSGAQRGPKALAGFAKKELSKVRTGRALGIRPHANRWYPARSRSTFSRVRSTLWIPKRLTGSRGCGFPKVRDAS